MWAKLKKLDYYRRSVIVGLPISAALLLFLIINHSSSLFLDSWFLDLITIPMFVGNLISGFSYFGRLPDFFQKDFPVTNDDPSKPSRKKERFGTLLGVFLGLAAGITLSVVETTIPFAPVLCGFANALFILNRMSIFAGLGTRIGNVSDKARPTNERISLGLAAIVGIGVGIALFLTSSSAFVSLAGVTTIFTGGLALPIWLSGIIFVSTFTSVIAAMADYGSKAVNFLVERNQQTPVGEFIRKGRYHEYRGSFLGSTLGLTIGILVIALLAITQPHLFVGVVGIAAAGFLLATAINVPGSTFSRVGRAMDGLSDNTPSSTSKIAQGLKISPAPALTAPSKPLTTSSAHFSSPLSPPTATNTQSPVAGEEARRAAPC